MFGKSTQEGSKLYLLAIYNGKLGPLCTFTLHFPQGFILLFSKVILWPFQKVAKTSGKMFGKITQEGSKLDIIAI